MHSKISRRYSLALFGVAQETGLLDKVAQDVKNVKDLIDSNRELSRFFESPVINEEKKIAVIKDLFKGKLTDLTVNFLTLLVQKKREGLTPYILEDFHQLKNEREGVKDVTIKTAVELSEDEKNKIVKKVENYTDSKVNPAFSIDKDIIGGFTVQIGDKVLDASIKNQLERLRTSFRKGEMLN